ncbi:hypothetical protein [Streptomyces sp. NBC_00083]|uniref:hypothetical protein n=1 Tax=Streptomyces sp. NBC_00083 TaxID=2975647 RepID=UPI002258E601|nr:hypothetical protein [Streptomyces sp. NBC_00083]MCX5387659.1 hypothetical protein [Streptomyces sp. NBC_00083]
MVSSFAVFVPPVITVLLYVVGVLPYALWVAKRAPSKPARWAVIGTAAAISAYGAGTLYGLAFTKPMDVCGDLTGRGVYMDASRHYGLTSVSVDAFPPSITCHWTSGNSTQAVGLWTTALLFAGLACALVSFALLLIHRYKHREAPHDIELDA